MEMIEGFDIKKRELTEEEANKEVTIERFDEFHNEAGEDFVEANLALFGFVNHHVFGGYLMAIYPDMSSEILKVCNDKFGETLKYLHMYEETFGEEDYYEAQTKFYTDLAKFINLTGVLKKRVNQVLIQVSEHYKD